VTWTSLLANKEAQKHKTSKKELNNMRALIARDLADASLAGLSADRRFATAYNAALQAANMAIACAGYFRPQHVYDAALCCPLVGNESLCVNAERQIGRSMAQHFLYYLDILFIRLQQS